VCYGNGTNAYRVRDSHPDGDRDIHPGGFAHADQHGSRVTNQHPDPDCHQHRGCQLAYEYPDTHTIVHSDADRDTDSYFNLIATVAVRVRVKGTAPVGSSLGGDMDYFAFSKMHAAAGRREVRRAAYF
jgi:hypothetical protein